MSEIRKKLKTEVEEIISKLPKPKHMSVFQKEGFYYLKVKFFDNGKRDKKKQRKFPQGFIGRIQLEGSPQNIIRDLKSIVGKFPKQ